MQTKTTMFETHHVCSLKIEQPRILTEPEYYAVNVSSHGKAGLAWAGHIDLSF